MSGHSLEMVGGVGRVVVVGHSPHIDETVESLEAAFGSESVIRVATIEDALERLDGVDGVVCEFDLDDPSESVGVLATERPDVPVVAVADREEADRALEAGATDVIDTADSPRVVAARIRAVTDRSGDDTRRYRSILASAAVVVCVLEPDGTVVDASPAVERQFGYTPGELERTAFSQFIDPDDRESVREAITDASAASIGATEQAQVRFGRADGTWLAVELTIVNRIEDSSVGGLVTTIGRLTPGDPDGVLQSAIDRLEGPLFVLGPEWELRYWNEAATTWLEGDLEAGAVVWRFLPGESRERLYDRFHEAKATESTIRAEVLDPDGEGRLELTISPDEDRIIVTGRPIQTAPPDREAAAVADRDRLERLEGALDALEDGVAILEGETIQVANATLSGWAGGEALVGRSVESLFDDDLAETVRERAETAVIRWMEPVRGSLAVGDGRPVEVVVSPIARADGTLCVVRDRRRSAGAALEAIRATVRATQSARTEPAVRRATVDGVRDCLEAAYVGWYRVDEAMLEPAAVATAERIGDVDTRPIPADEPSIAELLEADTGTAFDRADLIPVLTRLGIRAERVLGVVADGAVVLAVSRDPLPAHPLEQAALEVIAETASIALDRLGARSALRETRRTLSHTDRRLEQASHVREIEREILSAPTQEAIERSLCSGVRSLSLESGGSVEFAWVGRLDAGAEAVEPSVWTGREETLEPPSVPIGAKASDPAGRAMTRQASVVVTDFESLETASNEERWVQECLAAGVGSAISVPIEYDGFQYGTVTAYADRVDAFDVETRRSIEHLSAVAGHAIGALKLTQALLAETVTELEVGLREPAEPLSTIAQSLERRLDIRTTVPRSTGGSTVYCAIEAIEEDTITSLAESIPELESVSVLGGGDNGVPVEFVLNESTVAERVGSHGGSLRSIRPDDGHTRLVVDLPSSVDVRSFVRTLERAYPGTQLLARRETDRTEGPTRAFEAELRDRLSERQLRTLETAYYSGFFEWPREHTGEEVAESLGVSQPTFSRHFRMAQRKLFELLFENQADS